MIVRPSFRKGFGIGVIQRRMCGIALIVSGIRIDLSSLDLEYAPPPPVVDQVVFSVDDLKEALWRRGPDSLGTEKVFLQSKVSISGGEEQILPITRGLEETNGDDFCLQCIRNKLEGMYFSNRETPKLANSVTRPKCVPELHFFGAALQLRGINPINQPLVDECGNILVYNGEIFGGVPIGFSCNDGEFLMQSLGKCCSCNSHEQTTACDCNLGGKSSVPELLSAIKGPWAVVYWQNSSKTLWFGRDAFGRRSLLVHWPTLEDSRLLLSSVSPRSSLNKDIEFEADSNIGNLTFWEELPCGVYSIHCASSKLDGCLTGEVRKHEWASSMIKELIKWERTSVEPKLEDLQLSRIKLSGAALASDSLLAQRVLTALRESVMRRSTQNANFQAVPHEVQLEARVPVAILFSGGLDSMIIAALLDGCLEPCYGIDLLNVSFDGEFAPDRISAKAGIRELRRIAPLRRWKLVEIDADLSMLALETKHVTSLITPAKTYMDLNIGVALWLAAGGDGWVAEGFNNNVDEVHLRVKYKSESRILLVGSGADEQCAGYGRHKTKYRQGGWKALHEEMRLDMQRIWKRNLGRDDRCISDNGKEARFPFLDEDVIRTLLDIPLWNIADLDQPSGRGDKKILREVAQMLGIYEAATLPKRAIQFGSRIARESNKKNFGSNRAANQASAGSAVFSKPSSCT